ncbi:hypothetical protein DFH06DRAFT_448619 [Mycena polygramma]|nr:hypothetical protein DFH06DRAFT_190194 [Mycena polygramma]KAJ7658287.1 hypothetical protein DFH06DRAFT_448619 [Mycena polygramma]
MHRGSILALHSHLPMFPKILSVTLLAFFALSAAASPETQAIGDPCSATQPCISGGHCCLARKRGVILNRGTCLPQACP